MSEWPVQPLEDCLEVLIDYRGKSPKKSSSGIPVLSAKVIKNGKILRPIAQAVSPSYYEQWMTRGFPKLGDVVLTTEGPLGEVAQIDDEKLGLGQRIVTLRGKPDVLDTTYLKYFLMSPTGQSLLQARATGTTVEGISQKALRSLPITVPPIKTQQDIANILYSIEQKYELNQRMNETLETMARALFKSWFVDFDPVRAKAASREPEGMDAATAALFPAAFNEDGLPEGWDKVPFSGLIEIIGGGTPKTSVSEYWNGAIPWFSVVDAPAETNVYVIDTEKKITQAGVENSSTKVLPLGATIISARGTVGRIALVGVPMAMNQSCYAIRGDGFPDYFTYFAVRQLVKELKVRTHGSVFDTITRDTFDTVSFTKPNKKVADAFDRAVASMMQQVLINLHENRTLSSFRDALLPKLISGELRIGDTKRKRG